jgi:hypothetical protein
MNIIMRKYIYGLMMCIATLAFTSCEKTSQDNSVITYYVTMELNGDEVVQVPLGSTFVDEGVVATEGSDDITSSVIVDNPVNSNQLGVYTVTYSAINKDGFPSSISRTVVVYDPADENNENIEGTYYVATGSFRNYNGTITQYAGYTVNIIQQAPGIYYVSDYMGGWYEQRAGYGSNYAMQGYLKQNADNTLDIISGDVAGWGDSYDAFENGVYDPATGTISWSVQYASVIIFNVILSK